VCQLLDGERHGRCRRQGRVDAQCGGTGYYRFELPKAEWDRLIASRPAAGRRRSGLGRQLRQLSGRAFQAKLAELARTM
jgi:hypothetical protein